MSEFVDIVYFWMIYVMNDGDDFDIVHPDYMNHNVYVHDVDLMNVFDYDLNDYYMYDHDEYNAVDVLYDNDMDRCVLKHCC